MRILYVTWNVLGDTGANASELFPRYSALDVMVERVIVADDARNRELIRNQQMAEFFLIRRSRFSLLGQLRAAVRIARKSKDEEIDVIHVFYRLKNVPLVILLGLFQILIRSKAKVIVDHRSVNLARGFRAFWKKLANFCMQPFVDVLCGNPWAVETNHWWVWKPKRILDLGYDSLPPYTVTGQINSDQRSIWFIGSIKPRNRKSDFLICVFDEMSRRLGSHSDIVVRVAGPALAWQKAALNANPIVKYYGSLPRTKLYELLKAHPGVGAAFMNTQYHEFAPSLKFCEYAIMRYRIVAADTLGLRTQAKRMNLPDVVFTKETVEEWADHLIEEARAMNSLQSAWKDASLWSYASIYERQVRRLHKELAGKVTKRQAG